MKMYVELINIAHILCRPELAKSLPTSSLKLCIPMVTNKLTLTKFFKYFTINKFVNNLDLELF